jgi:surfeit locus 1 family protein
LTGRRILWLVLFDLAVLLVVAGLIALAVWQTHRRAWKLDLIARVEARISAPATAPPPRERWPDVSAGADEYRRVTVTGRWLEDRSALVLAVTEHGRGYWVMAPLVQNDGTAVLVNRGFVPADKRELAFWGARNEGFVTVTGLLRLSEPRGAFLRTNDPAADRWFSRDVKAIAASRALPPTAPYFIDAERPPHHTGLPIPGLTVIAFPNNHLIYALTWAALASMAAAGAVFVNIDLLRSSAKSGRLERMS